MADIFEDNNQLDGWRLDLWDLIRATPNLDWLLLTKRPENVCEMTRFVFSDFADKEWQLPANIWIGTSVENQEYADKRIPELLKIPATVRFLSAEPLLGSVDLEDLAYEAAGPEWAGFNPLIDWVIVGGESGHGARPMHPDWARGLRDQCQEAGIAFHFKQWGEWFPLSQRQDTGVMPMMGSYTSQGKNHWIELEGERFERVGKKAAGHLLDSRVWDEFPAVKA